MFSGQSWFNDVETVQDYDQIPTPKHAKVDWGSEIQSKSQEITINYKEQKQDFTVWFFPLIFLFFIMACVVYFIYY